MINFSPTGLYFRVTKSAMAKAEKKPIFTTYPKVQNYLPALPTCLVLSNVSVSLMYSLSNVSAVSCIFHALCHSTNVDQILHKWFICNFCIISVTEYLYIMVKIIGQRFRQNIKMSNILHFAKVHEK